MPTFTKDPDANLDYQVDWSSWLGLDTIQASVWVVPAGLTNTAETNTTTTATVWLSGGKKGVTYTVVNRITTAAGRVDDRAITVEITDK